MRSYITKVTLFTFITFHLLNVSYSYNETCNFNEVNPKLLHDPFDYINGHRCFCGPGFINCHKVDQFQKRITVNCSSCWMVSEIDKCLTECWLEEDYEEYEGDEYYNCYECLCFESFSHCTTLNEGRCKFSEETSEVDIVDLKQHIHTCERCTDVFGDPYIDGDIWNSNIVECKCHNRTTICYLEGWDDVYLPFDRKTCNECINLDITDDTLIQGCYFHGYNFTHKQQKYVNINGNGGCVYCACYAGDIKCLQHINETFLLTCEGEQNCTNFVNNSDVVNRCALPMFTLCYNHEVTWNQNGCKWECSNNTIGNSNNDEDTWCHILTSAVCLKCPEDKTRFVLANEDLLWQCPSGKVIWKYKICDNTGDCEDMTDETNCTESFCSPEVLRIGSTEYLTPINQENGKSIYVRCDSLLELFDDGIIEIKCETQTSGYKHLYNECNCHETEIHIQTNENLTTFVNYFQEILTKPLRRFKYINIKTRFMEYINLTTFNESENNLLRYAIQLMGTVDNIGRCDFREPNIRFMIQTDKRVKSEVHEIAERYNTSISGLGERGSYTSSFSRLYKLEVSDRMIQDIREAFRHSEKNTITRLPDDESSSDIKPVDVLFMIDMVLTSISFLCLMFGVTLYLIHRSKHAKTKLHLHINLMGIYGMSLLVQILPNIIDFRTHRIGCIIMLYLAYFTIFSTYSWMVAEGINIMIILLFAMQNKEYFLVFYYIIGYGIPVVILSILSAVYLNSFLQTTTCLSVQGNLSIIKWPEGVMVLMNLFILLVTTCVLIYKRKNSADLRKSSLNFSDMLKSFVSLSILLGGTFFMGLFLEDASVVYAYVHVIINGSMGIVMFILHTDGATIMKNCILSASYAARNALNSEKSENTD